MQLLSGKFSLNLSWPGRSARGLAAGENNTMAYRLGVDVGGTFTDLLLMDEDTGNTYEANGHSTPEDSSKGVFVR